jgi:hypothetical protein
MRFVRIAVVVGALILFAAAEEVANDLAGQTCALGPGLQAGCVRDRIATVCIAPLPPYHAKGYCGPCAAAALGGISVRCVSSNTWGNVSTVRGEYGVPLSCQTGDAAVALCGSLADPCADPSYGGGQVGLRCASLGFNVSADSCEWRPAAFDGLAGCEVNEVLVGVCLSRTAAGACFSAPYGVSVRCCANRTAAACAASPSWRYLYAAGSSCSSGTALRGLCAFNCDPGSLYGPRNNAGMFACSGWTPWSTYGRYRSECAPRVTCPAGMVVTAAEQCYELSGPGVRATCAKPSFASVTGDCVENNGSGFLWCPRDYAATAICGPNLPNACPAGTNAQIRCCRVRSYHSLGTPCPSAVGTTLLRAMPALPAGYGIDSAFPALNVSIGAPRGVSVCGDYVLVSTALHVIIRLRLTQNTVNLTMGSVSNAGIDGSIWTPAQWDQRATRVNNPGDVRFRPGCASAVFADEQNFMVREISIGVLGGSLFNVDQVVGEAGSAPRTLINRSSVLTAQLPSIGGVLYRESDGTLFISVAGAVLLADAAVPVGSPTLRSVRYYLGDGSPAPVVLGAFRTETHCEDPGQLELLDDTKLYVSDRRAGVGGVLWMALETGIVDRLPLPSSLATSGIVLHVSYTGVRTLFVASSDSHTVWRVNLATLESWLFAGQSGSPGSSTNAPLIELTFRNPTRLAASANQLFVVDEGNSRVQQLPITSVCAEGQDAAFECLVCAAGFFGFPRCRRSCSNEADCSARAAVVTGDPSTTCRCSCATHWSGASCGACSPGWDARYACTRCLPGYFGPECNTASRSLSYSLSPSRSIALPSSTDSPSLQPTESTTNRVTRSATFSRTNRTISASLEATPSRSDNGTLTAGKSLTPPRTRSASSSGSFTVVYSRTLSQTADATGSRSVSLQLTKSLTVTPSLSAAPTLSEEPSGTRTASNTQRPSRSGSLIATETVTSSWPLIAAVVTTVGRGYVWASQMGSGSAEERAVFISLSGGQIDPSIKDFGGCVHVVALSGVEFGVSVDAVTFVPSNTLRVVFRGRDDNRFAGTIRVTVVAECIIGRRAPRQDAVVFIPREPDRPLLRDSLFDPIAVSVVISVFFADDCHGVFFFHDTVNGLEREIERGCSGFQTARG